MRIFIVLAILLCIDLYVFQGLRVLTAGREVNTQRIVYATFWFITLVAVSTIVMGQFIDWHTWPRALSTYLFALVVILYLSKVFVVAFLFTDDIVRVFRWTALKAQTLFSSGPTQELAAAVPQKGISRLTFLVQLGFIVGAVPLVSMVYGMIKGATDYTVRRKAMKFPNLPDSFHNFRIVQISDLHLGSYLSQEPMERAVQLIMEQKPDVILFTGDMVNDRHVEAVPFREILKKLQAPHGVYSVLGNHDYGEYYRWPSQEDKKQNLENLVRFQRDLGWNLLLNEHAYLEKDGEQLGLIGVENWSSRMSFQRYGDMKKAVDGMKQLPVNILMSHDPSHWKAEVVKEYPQVDLTLSGHTHGMQFGVEIPGFKWSPVQYVYKEWADLYNDKKQYLYVNRGLGFIGYPGRVGILPEITVIDLEKA